jgi:hypothetical protein
LKLRHGPPWYFSVAPPLVESIFHAAEERAAEEEAVSGRLKFKARLNSRWADRKKHSTLIEPIIEIERLNPR